MFLFIYLLLNVAVAGFTVNLEYDEEKTSQKLIMIDGTSLAI